MYKNNPNYSLWLFFLLVPATLCTIFPGTMGTLLSPALGGLDCCLLCGANAHPLPCISLHKQYQAHHTSDQVRP